MRRVFIDANTCIEYFKHRSGVPDRMNQESRDDLCVSEVTIPMPGVEVENWIKRKG